MLIVMDDQSGPELIENVLQALHQLGFETTLPSTESGPPVIDATGPQGADLRAIQNLPGVLQLANIDPPYHLPSREFQPEDSVLTFGPVTLGGPELAIFAGPCSVEDEEELHTIAGRVRAAGAIGLRGGAFKPRTSPYSFQGFGEPGLKALRAAADAHGLLAITEVLDTRHVEMTADYADLLQVGSRNMENYPLLREVGRAGKPVMLKRGRSATIEEWLMAAEYIMVEGNSRVILCERGIRTFEPATRNTLDLSAIPVVKELSHLPILVDPSHGTGSSERVIPMSRAAIAAGADGLLIEVHPNPQTALSDGAQSIRPEQFDRLMTEVAAIAKAVGRRCEAESYRPVGSDPAPLDRRLS